MCSRAVLSILSALMYAASARVIQRQDDAHIADFRTWDSADCTDGNQGIWTFTKSQLNIGCQAFASYNASVGSLTLVDIVSSVDSECTLKVFDNEGCQGAGEDAYTGECSSSPGGWKSFWLLYCNDSE